MSSEPDRVRIDACHHIGLAVRDLDEAQKFYAAVLNLQQIERPAELLELNPGIWFRLGAQELHLFPAAEVIGRDSAVGHHFAVRVPLFHEFCEEVRTAGGVFSIGPLLCPDGMWRAFVEDPSGNLVEINDGALHGANDG